jgi:hypothetical protein
MKLDRLVGWGAAATTGGAVALIVLVMGGTHESVIAEGPAPQAEPVQPPPPDHWQIGDAALTLNGSLSGRLESGASSIQFNTAAAKNSREMHVAINGDSPVSVNGYVTGPGGPVLDISLTAFGLPPLTIQGTPGKDLALHLGRQNSLPHRLVAAKLAAPAAAITFQDVANAVWRDWLRSVVAFTMVGLLLFIIVPGLTRHAGRLALRRPWASLAIGALVMVDVPLLALILIVVGLPLGLWWLGLFALFLLGALAAVGFAYAGLQLGKVIFDNLGLVDRWSEFAALPAGVALLCLVLVIPVLGQVVALLAMVYGIGSLLMAERMAREAEVRAVEAVAIPGARPALD